MSKSAIVMSRGAGYVSSSGPSAFFRTRVRGKFRRPSDDRIVEAKLAFLHQHEDERRCDRLGHRADAEQRVSLHRQIAPDVSLSKRRAMGDLAVPPDERHRARRIARGDRAFDRGRNPRERRWREGGGAAHRDWRAINGAGWRRPGPESLAALAPSRARKDMGLRRMALVASVNLNSCLSPRVIARSPKKSRRAGDISRGGVWGY